MPRIDAIAKDMELSQHLDQKLRRKERAGAKSLYVDRRLVLLAHFSEAVTAIEGYVPLLFFCEA